MTISYSAEVPNGSAFGCFWKILWKWVLTSTFNLTRQASKYLIFEEEDISSQLNGDWEFLTLSIVAVWREAKEECLKYAREDWFFHIYLLIQKLSNSHQLVQFYTSLHSIIFFFRGFACAFCFHIDVFSCSPERFFFCANKEEKNWIEFHDVWKISNYCFLFICLGPLVTFYLAMMLVTHKPMFNSRLHC